MPGERGQATVEWVAIVLAAALALGALLAFAPSVEGRGLGAVLVHRLTCAVRGSCGERAGERRESPRAPETVVFGAAPPGAAPPRAAPPPAAGAPPARPRAAPAPRSPVTPRRATAAFRALRGVRAVARRAWIVCLGWERYRFERTHPDLAIPGRPMPVREALRIANTCLNPALFLVGEDDP